MKKFLSAMLFLFIAAAAAEAAKYEPVPAKVKMPEKYTSEYIDEISATYKKNSNDQIIFVALDMLQGTTGEFSRNAILGDNLTGKPVKIEFKNLSEINPNYEKFDA